MEGHRIMLTELWVDTAPEQGALGDGEFVIDREMLTITWLSTNPTRHPPPPVKTGRRRWSMADARVTDTDGSDRQRIWRHGD